jgi:hypothetical protein
VRPVFEKVTQLIEAGPSSSKPDFNSTYRISFRTALLAICGPLSGESVEGSPIVFSGKIEERLDILGGVSTGTPVDGNARNQNICGGSVIDIVGQHLLVDGPLGHPTILPSTCSMDGQTLIQVDQL